MKKKQLIMIVDDDADDREIIRDAFQSGSSSPEYLFMENGDRLLQHLDTCPDEQLPSLILIDLNMPGKDGREALREIKGNDRLKSIPTVVLTTSSSPRDRQVTYNLGANCFVTKPDSFNKMLEITGSISKLWLQ